MHRIWIMSAPRRPAREIQPPPGFAASQFRHPPSRAQEYASPRGKRGRSSHQEPVPRGQGRSHFPCQNEKLRLRRVQPKPLQGKKPTTAADLPRPLDFRGPAGRAGFGKPASHLESRSAALGTDLQASLIHPGTPTCLTLQSSDVWGRAQGHILLLHLPSSEAFAR